MKVDDIISRHTSASGRTLLMLGVAVLFGKVFDVSLAKLSFLKDAGLDDMKMDWAAVIVLSYLLVAHSTNWYNDWISYGLKTGDTSHSATFDEQAQGSLKERDLVDTWIAKGSSPSTAPEDLHSKRLMHDRQAKLFGRRSRGRQLLIEVKELALPVSVGWMALCACMVSILRTVF